MVDVKTVVASVVIVLSVFLQPGIRAQPTIDSSSVDDSCSQREEEWEFQRVENQRLQSALESERQTMKTLEDKLRRLRKLELKSVTATFIGSFDHSQSHYAITKVEDKIYVIDHHPNRIRIYEDLIGFRFVRDIALSGTGWPFDIVYSNKSQCVYISDTAGRCIWVMTTTGGHRLSKWLSNATGSLSLSNEGHVLVRRWQSFSQDSVEFYSLNATLIRTLHLPQDTKHPHGVVQTLDGNFIISHKLNNASSRQWIISQFTNDGQLIHRFIPRNQSEILVYALDMSLDSDNNRLFVADCDNHRVIIFDSSVLTWSQVLVSQEKNGIVKPHSLLYDASKKHLLVAQFYTNVTVYKIN